MKTIIFMFAVMFVAASMMASESNAGCRKPLVCPTGGFSLDNQRNAQIAFHEGVLANIEQPQGRGGRGSGQGRGCPPFICMNEPQPNGGGQLIDVTRPEGATPLSLEEMDSLLGSGRYGSGLIDRGYTRGRSRYIGGGS